MTRNDQKNYEQFEEVKKELTQIFKTIRPLAYRRKSLCESLEGQRIRWEARMGTILGTMDCSGEVLIKLDGEVTPKIVSVPAWTLHWRQLDDRSL